jgi:hypothetical protein
MTIREAIHEPNTHKDNIWGFNKTGFAIGLCSTSKVIIVMERGKDLRELFKETVNGSQLFN